MGDDKKAFTLLEVMITLLIAGIIALLAVPNILSLMKDFQVKEGLLELEQTVKQARNIAISKSRTVSIDFSQAGANHDTNGGLMQIKQKDGTVISQIYFNKNVLYNAGLSNIQQNQIIFNFNGQPVDSSGATSGFTTSNNKVTISYYSTSGSVLASKYLKVTPGTGNIEPQ